MLVHRRPLSPAEAVATTPLAERWLEAWNAHDVDRIASLYAPNARHTSERVRAFTSAEDTVRGKDAIAEYFRRALAQSPALHFEPISVSTGPRTVALEYRAQGGERDETTVELLELNAEGLIEQSRVYHRR